MTIKHTPGPWRVIEDGGFRGVFALALGTKVAAIIGSIREGEHVDANARLIAAAPDMLAALRWAMDHAEWSNDTESGTDPIRLAIAKATGE